MARRLLVLAAVLGLSLLLAGVSLGATVTMRVEGKTRSIFGSTPVTVNAANPLAALVKVGRSGIFDVQLKKASFGTYVTRIGRDAAAGAAGWAFKVNGVSPPVGADQVKLKPGDDVLWYYATFGTKGGPPTLSLKASSGDCYTVTAVDDAGKAKPAARAKLVVDGRSFAVAADGRACVGPHTGAVLAVAAGAVRSNSVR